MLNRIILTALLLLSVPLWGTAATVVLPKTGQTLCYNANGAIDCAGTGQDGETQIGAAWPNPRFTNNGNGTVTDNLTRLIWLRDALCTALNPPPANPALSLQGGRDWASALTAANTLMTGQCGLNDDSGIGDWRLPNVNELESLVDLSQSNPPLPVNHPFLNFPVPYPVYWTSTTTGDYFPGINAIGQDFFTGKIQGDTTSAPKYVWPVKGDSTTLARTGQHLCWDPLDTSASGKVIACNGRRTDGDLQKGVPLPSQRFSDNVNGTITDSLTGLTWPKNAGCFSNISSQGQAITLAKTFGQGTCGLVDGSVPGDWRLPNRKEMRSLVDYGGTWLAEFTGAPPHGWYWTSDSYAVLPFSYEKWVVKSQGLDWLNGELLTYLQFPLYFMLPVRGALNFSGTVTITLAGLNQTYDGTPKLVTATTSPAGFAVTVTYAGSTTPPTKAESYPVVATVDDPVHHESTSGTLVISKASGTVTLGSLSQTYNGTPRSATATTVPPGGSVLISYPGRSSAPIDAESYPVVATIDDPNFLTSSTSGTMIVAKAPGTVTLGNLSQVYDGTAKNATATTSPAVGKVTLTYAGGSSAPTNAGTYRVVATISDTNYQGSATGDLVIAKAAATVTLASLKQVYDGTAKNATATTSPDGKSVSFSYTPANPVNAGSYAVVAMVSDPNYSGTASGSLTVTQKTPTVTWSTPAAIATGTALSTTQLNATGSVPGSFVYTPSIGALLPAGSQTLSALFTPTDSTNYATASASVLLTVASNFTVTFDPGGGSLIGKAIQTVVGGASTSAVSAVPATGYHFTQWTGPGNFTSTSNPLIVADVSANQTLAANYAVNTFLVTSSAPGGNGSISCSSPVNYGANCICSVTPDAGYHVFTLTDNDADRMLALSGGTFTITGVTANHVVSTTFARPTGILYPATGKTSPDIADALAVLKIVLKMAPGTAADLARADIAPLGSDGKPLGDGKLDIYDVIGILRMLIGI